VASFEILRRRTGETFTVLVDEDDLDRVLATGRWHVSPKGYVRYSNTSRGSGHSLHRFVLDLGSEDPLVDHKNGNRLDNRKSNLVLSTSQLNGANRAVIGRASSGIRGVNLNKSTGKWQAVQKVNYKNHYLGLYTTVEEAAEAVKLFREQNELGGY
jgi:hypothetical protein